jgi:outer membrane protein
MLDFEDQIQAQGVFMKVMTGSIAAIFMGCLLTIAPAQAAELKIGYIDMQKAIQETSAGKKAKKDLEKEFNAKKEEVEKKRADLKKMSDDLKKKESVLSDDVKDKKQAELNQEMMKLQEFMGQSQMTLQKKEQELTRPILEKLQKVIDQVAKDGGYTMILEKSGQGVLWAKKDVDLTDEVVKQYEKAK